MIHTLENSEVHLEINPSIARYTASGKQRGSPSLDNCQIYLKFARNRIGGSLLDRWPECSISNPEPIPSSHGQLNQVHLDLASEKYDLHCRVTFALPDEGPLLLWRISINNQGPIPVFINEIELLSAGFIHRGRYGPNGSLHFPDVRERIRGQSRRPRITSQWSSRASAAVC